MSAGGRVSATLLWVLADAPKSFEPMSSIGVPFLPLASICSGFLGATLAGAWIEAFSTSAAAQEEDAVGVDAGFLKKDITDCCLSFGVDMMASCETVRASSSRWSLREGRSGAHGFFRGRVRLHTQRGTEWQ